DVLLNSVARQTRDAIRLALHVVRDLVTPLFLTQRNRSLVRLQPILQPNGDVFDARQAEDIAAHWRHEIIDPHQHRPGQSPEARSDIKEHELVPPVYRRRQLTVPIRLPRAAEVASAEIDPCMAEQALKRGESRMTGDQVDFEPVA